MDRSLVICKPDAVERGLTGTIIDRLERKGLRLVAVELRVIEPDLAERHYAEHRGRPFYDNLVKFISRAPSLVMVVEGPEETWQIVRTLIGATDPVEAAPGTIRGDFATYSAENLVHGSDGPDSAVREVALFFPGLA
jgi:nucleoside-diphosphate kinase